MSIEQQEAALELERVRGILASLPTTEQQDTETLLQREYEGDYLAEAIVKWRVLRKKALRRRAESLQLLLEELCEGSACPSTYGGLLDHWRTAMGWNRTANRME